MPQIPRGSSDAWCPFWKKRMSTVCHTCALWKELSVTNQATGEVSARWECSIGMMPTLAVEIALQSRQAGAAVESTRNEMVKAAERAQDMQIIAAKHIADAIDRSSQSTIHALGVVAGEISTHKLSDQVSVRLLEQADDPK